MTKPTFEVCLTPALIHQFDLQGKVAVVVDILRATSCFTSGVGSGVPHIIPFLDLEECRAMKSEGYLIAGERNGAKVEGFDIGNSPFDYIDAAQTGKPVAVTTTNGTTAISVSKPADEVLIGSFLNISSLSKKLIELSKPVVVVCAGWKGRVNLEDTLFAGALADLLTGHFILKEDTALVALKTYGSSSNDLFAALETSSHVQRLKKLEIGRDIEYCVSWDKFTAVPGIREDKIILL